MYRSAYVHRAKTYAGSYAALEGICLSRHDEVAGVGRAGASERQGTGVAAGGRQGAGVADFEGLGEGGGGSGPSPFLGNHSFLIASSTAVATI